MFARYSLVVLLASLLGTQWLEFDVDGGAKGTADAPSSCTASTCDEASLKNLLQALPILTEQILVQARAADASDTADPTALVYVRLSRECLAKRIEREVNRTKPITDVILGTKIQGETTTKGQTRLVLRPTDDRALAVIEFTGTSTSQTKGKNGPAILHYSSDSTFRATKTIELTAAGIVCEPAVAEATTKLHVDRIESTMPGIRGRIVEQVAQRRVADSAAQADAAASKRTAARIERDLDAAVERSMNELSSSLAAAVKSHGVDLASLTAEPDGLLSLVQFRTTDDCVELALMPSGVQLCNPDCALPKIDGSPAIALRVNRCVITGAASTWDSAPTVALLAVNALQDSLVENASAILPFGKSQADANTNWSLGVDWLAFDIADVLPKAEQTPASKFELAATSNSAR